MASDRKYLQQRGPKRVWYIRVPTPPREWGLGGREFVASLGTADLDLARAIRDQYLIPLLAATRAGRFVGTLAQLAAQADAEIAERLEQLRPGFTGRRRRSSSLAEAVQSFLAFLETSGSYAPPTLRKYRAVLEGACDIIGEDADCGTLTKADAIKYRDTLLALPLNWQRRSENRLAAATKEQKSNSPNNVSKCLMNVRRLFRWLIDEGRVSRRDNPFDGVDVARVLTNHKRCPSSKEADALCKLEKPGSFGDALAWGAMPMIARYTGMRAGEIAQLHAEDVVDRDGIRCLQVTSHREGRSLKTASSERLVPVADSLAPYLNRLLARRKKARLMDTGTWTGKDGTTKHAHGYLKFYNRRAKKVAPDLSFHCWRVYANDAMATAGVDIGDRERLLGHRSPRTQGAYTPENLHRLKAAVDAIP